MQLETAGHLADAVKRARRAVDLDPDDEKGVARLIAMLDRLGDRSGALTVYAALERRLADGFSAQPAPETRALMHALRQRPTPVYTPPPAQPVVPTVNPRPDIAFRGCDATSTAPLHGRCRGRARRDRTGGAPRADASSSEIDLRLTRYRCRGPFPGALTRRRPRLAAGGHGRIADDASVGQRGDDCHRTGSGARRLAQCAGRQSARGTPATPCEVREADRRRADRVRERHRNVGSLVLAAWIVDVTDGHTGLRRPSRVRRTAWPSWWTASV